MATHKPYEGKVRDATNRVSEIKKKRENVKKETDAVDKEVDVFWSTKKRVLYQAMGETPSIEGC